LNVYTAQQALISKTATPVVNASATAATTVALSDKNANSSPAPSGSAPKVGTRKRKTLEGKRKLSGAALKAHLIK